MYISCFKSKCTDYTGNVSSIYGCGIKSVSVYLKRFTFLLLFDEKLVIYNVNLEIYLPDFGRLR